MNESQVRVRDARPVDHGLAEIDADADSGAELIEKGARSTAQIKHALPGRDQKLQIAPVLFEKEILMSDPIVAFLRESIREFQCLLLAA